MGPVPWRSLALAAVATAIAAVPGATGALALHHGRLFELELWRVWTGHLVHGSPSHLLWNVAALIGLGFVFEPALGRRLWGLLAAGAVVVGIGLLVLQPRLESYIGLSGVLNTIWVGGALTLARDERGLLRWACWLCIALGLGKIVFEATTGLSVFTDPSTLGGKPLPLAHALGSLAGCLALVPARRTRPRGGSGVDHAEEISHEDPRAAFCG